MTKKERNNIQELVKEYQQTKSDDSFNKIYSIFQRKLEKFKLNKRTPYFDDWDFYQMVWMKIVKLCDMYDPEKSSFSVWFMLIARSVYLDIIKSAMTKCKHGEHSLQTYEDVNGELFGDIINHIASQKSENKQDSYDYILDQLDIANESRVFLLEYMDLLEFGLSEYRAKKLIGEKDFNERVSKIRETNDYLSIVLS